MFSEVNNLMDLWISLCRFMFYALHNYILCLQDTIPVSTIGDMQCLLLSVMCNVASIFLSKKSSDLVITDQIERSCFIEASIAFCKLQHLNIMITVKTQVSLVSSSCSYNESFHDDIYLFHSFFPFSNFPDFVS